MVAMMRRTNPCANRLRLLGIHRGYTLMEILIVVTILGILASLVTFSVMWAIRAAERAAFAANLRSFANAAHMYYTEYGYYPPEANPGELPVGLEKYIDVEDWQMATPLGGEWDITSGGGPTGSLFGIGVSMGDGFAEEEGNVIHEQVSVALEGLDNEIDDGDLNTGSFRKLNGSSFYLVIAE